MRLTPLPPAKSSTIVSFAIKIFLFVPMLMIVMKTSAQINMPPSDISCTSKDLYVTHALLPAPSNDLCACAGTRTLTLGINNKTGSNRTAFAMWGTLVRYNTDGNPVNENGDLITSGNIGVTIFACASGIKKNTEQSYQTSTPIVVKCNQKLIIRDVIMAWTSASPGETCDVLYNNPTTINPKCGRVDSILVEVGVAANFNKVNPTCTEGGKIGITPYGGKSPYDIFVGTYTNTENFTGTYTPTISFAAGTYSITIIDDNKCSIDYSIILTNNDYVALPTAQVTNPTCTVSTGTVSMTTYASTTEYKLKQNNIDYKTAVNGIFTEVAPGTYSLVATNGECSSSTTITVNAVPTSLTNPTADVVTPTCDSKAGTVSITNYTSSYTYTLEQSNTIKYTAINGIFAGVATGTYILKVTSGTCSGTANIIIPDIATSPGELELQIVNPTCSTSHGTITILNADTHSAYNNTIFEFSNGGTYTNTNQFQFTAGGGYSVTVRNIADGTCQSTATCGAEVVSSSRRSSNVSTAEYISIPESKPSVIAYPNPYNNKIRFIVTSPEKGRGSLELFNVLGQKMKTVYQGEIIEGTQVFEAFIPPQQRANLIYVMTLNGKTASGKMIAQ